MARGLVLAAKMRLGMTGDRKLRDLWRAIEIENKQRSPRLKRYDANSAGLCIYTVIMEDEIPREKV